MIFFFFGSSEINIYSIKILSDKKFFFFFFWFKWIAIETEKEKDWKICDHENGDRSFALKVHLWIKGSNNVLSEWKLLAFLYQFVWEKKWNISFILFSSFFFVLVHFVKSKDEELIKLRCETKMLDKCTVL